MSLANGAARQSVEIIGSGVMGLCAADFFRRGGADVTVISQSDGPDATCCSWWAAGMLAPDCEMETAENLIGRLGRESMAYWLEALPAAGLDRPEMRGTLVVATPRDLSELNRFSRRTEGWSRIDGEALGDMEPDLAGLFETALFFEEEGHLDPRRTLLAMRAQLQRDGVRFRSGERLDEGALSTPPAADWRIDCRGLAARDQLKDLRGVRGEMMLVKSAELSLSRPVRLLHPRTPLYIVPRDDLREEGVYMIGATVIESEGRGRDFSALGLGVVCRRGGAASGFRGS